MVPGARCEESGVRWCQVPGFRWPHLDQGDGALPPVEPGVEEEDPEVGLPGGGEEEEHKVGLPGGGEEEEHEVGLPGGGEEEEHEE